MSLSVKKIPGSYPGIFLIERGAEAQHYSVIGGDIAIIRIDSCSKFGTEPFIFFCLMCDCLLYTSDAADDKP